MQVAVPPGSTVAGLKVHGGTAKGVPVPEKLTSRRARADTVVLPGLVTVKV